jgi:hypothetical protein
MKRRIALSIAFTLGVVLVSLASSDSTAQAQPATGKVVADTGIVTLGPNQVLRLTLMGDFNGDADVDAADYVLFRRMEYGQETCGSDGVCKLVVTSQAATNPIRLRPGAALFYTNNPGSGLFGVRLVALSNRRSVRATATIINTITGETTSHIIVANTDGDIH